MFCHIPTGKPLHHIFTKNNAVDVVAKDMNQLHTMSNNRFSKFVTDKYVKESSIDVKLTRNVLKTFGTVKRKRPNVAKQLSDEKMHNEFLRRIIRFSGDTGTPVAHVGQLFELPRAIANSDGTPYKSSKAATKEFYRKRYKTTNLFSLHMPADVTTEAVIIDAMNVLYILEPSRRYVYVGNILVEQVPSFGSYASSFLSYIKHWLSNSVVELHIVFDNFNRTEYPKNCERNLRDSTSNQGPLMNISRDGATPKDWKSFLANRQNKYNLLNFLCREFMTQASIVLNDSQAVYVSGGFSGDFANKAFKITRSGFSECPELYSSHDEADSRIWLHAHETLCNEILIVSKDTDLYHIGLPILSVNTEKNIYMQLKLTQNYTNDDRYLHLNGLLSALKNDSDLRGIPQNWIPYFALLTYIASGCDFTSSFYQIGKSKFMDICFKEAKFIYLSPTVGGSIFNSLLLMGSCDACTADMFCDQCNGQLNSYMCGMARMIGLVYFYKVRSRLGEHEPQKLLDTFESDGWNAHSSWLSRIREETFRTAKFEDTCLPSNGALRMHSLRTLWVLRLYTIASQNGDIPLEPITRYGFNDDGTYKWDTAENLSKIQAKQNSITKGCGCSKTRCKSRQCSCVRKGKRCGPGCTCDNYNCQNLPEQQIPDKHIDSDSVDQQNNDTEYFECPEYESEEEVHSQSETEDDYDYSGLTLDTDSEDDF